MAHSRGGFRGEVPVDVIREYVERAMENGATAAELAVRAGFLRPTGNGDSTRLKRYVGLKPATDGGGRKAYRQTLTYPVAARLCEALDIDPVEAGL